MSGSDDGFPAGFFDGLSASAHGVLLSLESDHLCVRQPGGAVLRYPLRQVRWPEPTRHGALQIFLPDGGVIVPADGQDLMGWIDALGVRQPWAARWANHWRGVWVAAGLLVGVMICLWAWGMPWVAQRSVAYVPQTVRMKLDESFLKQVERKGWLKPSRLEPDRAARLQAELDAMIAAAYAALPSDERPRVQVAVHALPKALGPNAFALPGGQVVISDALLELLPDQGGRVHPGVLGVLAHEVGHVHHQHGLRMLATTAATSVMLGWWTGDFSFVLSSAPTLLLQASYSREFEREADAEALRIMQAAGVDPRGMLVFFQKLDRSSPAQERDALHFGLITHPPDSERIRLFESGSGS